jgi:cytochrome c
MHVPTVSAVPGFHYSDANGNSGITWTVNELDTYLTSPRQVVPGTLMTFPGLKNAKQRGDLIAYLATLINRSLTVK